MPCFLVVILTLIIVYTDRVEAFATPKADFLLDIDGNSVSTSRTRVCAIEQVPGHEMGGKIKCWEGNEEYVEFVPPDKTFIQVVTASTFSCGLTTSQEVYCWGDASNEAPHGALDGFYKQITAESRSAFMCGLRTDGSIKCYGQSAFMTKEPAGQFAQVSCSSHHCCALDSKGYPVCWAEHIDSVVNAPTITYQEYQLSLERDGWIVKEEADPYDEEDEQPLIPETGLIQFRQLSAADGITCGITLLGSHVICWGAKRVFRKGFPRAAQGPFRQISAGTLGVCAISSSDHPNPDSLTCWSTVKDIKLPTTQWDQVSLGCCGFCGVTLDSELVCWGYAFPDMKNDLKDFIVA